MGILFSPTPSDVERYRRFRALSRELGERMLKTVPPRAFDEIGDAIGMLRNGILVFDTMDMSGVLADCCLYDWFEDGRNLVHRYARKHPARPGTDEAYLLNAYCHATYRILTIHSAVPDAGLYVYDTLNEEELFLMDLGFSRSLKQGGVALATRTIPLGDYCMTGGAPLPITSADAVESTLLEMDEGPMLAPRDGPAGFSLSIVRACLGAGAAEHVKYVGAEDKPKERPRMPGWQGSKRRHRPS
jgi:hypothetical protein